MNPMQQRGPHFRGGAATALALLLVVVVAGSSNAESATVGASVRIASLDVTLTLSALEARVGETVRARAVVDNLGSTSLSDVAVELRVSSEGVRTRGESTVIIPRMKPGHTAIVSWTLCTLQEGNFVVFARVTGDGASVDSPARVLSIAGRRHRGCT